MKYARIEISKKRWEMREASVPIVVFARFANQDDEVIYAPKSQIIIEKEFAGMSKTPRMIILVPMWIFAKKGVKAWNADTFIDMIEK